MKKIIFFIFIFSTTTVSAQKVAVVLSGGGAKGMAHIGVLKALEENEIPIDYIVGTSMGGIIAACYASGMSPEQIEQVMVHDNLLNWINGKLEKGYSYHYSQDDDHSSFIKVNLNLDSTFSFKLNTTLAKDFSINFAIAEKFANPTAIAKENFDSLFVPLRIVSADIFTQKQVILKSGIVGDAVRSTMTVPFFFNPIRVDGKYLFDGGLYNNFPVDVAQKEFKPDVIIGSDVSGKEYDEYPTGKDEKLIYNSMLLFLLDKSSPKSVPESGVYIHPDLKDYTSRDFEDTKSIIDSGYFQTIRKIPELKSKIAKRISSENVSEGRDKFLSRSKNLLVKGLEINGYNKNQKRYITQFFQKIYKKRPFNFERVKSDYYRLTSEKYFENVYPSFRFNSSLQAFDLVLTKRPSNNFHIDFGGCITTREISNLYLGLNYYHFSRWLTHAKANFYAGGFFKAIQLNARLDFSFLTQFFLEPEITVNSWNFTQSSDYITKPSSFSSLPLKRVDRKFGITLGLPIGKKYLATIRLHQITNDDRYLNTLKFSAPVTFDHTSLVGGKYGIGIASSNLNRKQYPTKGKSFNIGLDWYDLYEVHTPGSTSVLKDTVGVTRDWLRFSINLEQYFNMKFYTFGYYFQGVLSNQSSFQNYTTSLINAPGFYPLQDTRSLMLKKFRAYNFVAAGCKNIFTVRKNLDIRAEGYLFYAFENIAERENQRAEVKRNYSLLPFVANLAVVLHSSIGPISVSMNYYDESESPFGFLIHAGFLLFNKTSMDQ